MFGNAKNSCYLKRKGEKVADTTHEAITHTSTQSFSGPKRIALDMLADITETEIPHTRESDELHMPRSQIDISDVYVHKHKRAVMHTKKNEHKESALTCLPTKSVQCELLLPHTHDTRDASVQCGLLLP